MADIDRIKGNVRSMIDQGAPEADIDAYLKTEGVTAEQLKGGAAMAAQPKMPRSEIAWRGFKQGASSDWGDEIYGASQASGLDPMWGGFRAPFGAGKIWQERSSPQIKGDNITDVDPNQIRQGPGPIEEKYIEERNKDREANAAARKQGPWTYGLSELGGATLMPTGKVRAVTGPGRVAEQMGWGAGYGFLGGTGSAEKDTLAHGVVGAGIGAPIAGIVPGVVEGANWMYSPFRGWKYEDAEAARRIKAAADAAGVSPAEIQRMLAEAHANGQPAVISDVLGEPGKSLLRSASDTSLTGRQQLTNVLRPRMEEHKPRTMDYVRQMAGGDANVERDLLKMDMTPKNKPLYDKAYAAGDRPIGPGNPELETLMSVPQIVNAMKETVTNGKARAVADGYAGFNPGAEVTPDGRLIFNGGRFGVPTYPNLQFWDYTYRNVRDAAYRGEMPYGLAVRLRRALDAEVPEFAAARGHVAQFFNADNALEAGREFFRGGFDSYAAEKILKTATDEERRLFKIGFAHEWQDSIKNSSTAQVPSKLNTSQPSGLGMAEKAKVAMGASDASRLETYMAWEDLMKGSYNALTGGSITARRAIELGLAGSVGGGGMTALDVYSGHISPLDITVGTIMGAAAKRGHQMINERVVRRVAEMLTSNDWAMVQKGLDMTLAYPWLRDAIRQGSAQMARGASTWTGGEMSPYLLPR